MVDFWSDYNIIMQPVIAYKHTMQARVESDFGCSQ